MTTTKKIEKLKKYLEKWIVPISKDYNSKKELSQFKETITTCDTRMAKLKNNKWILVRQLKENDLKSLDFIKYVSSFPFKKITRVYK